jgi:hypothetical protein
MKLRPHDLPMGQMVDPPLHGLWRLASRSDSTCERVAFKQIAKFEIVTKDVEAFMTTKPLQSGRVSPAIHSCG